MHILDLRHEYMLLLGDVYPLLQPDDRKTILSTIAAGPSSKNWDLTNATARTNFDLYARLWKRDKLSMISDHLDADWKGIYEGLTESLGKPAHPEYLSYRTQVFVGPVSPRSAEDLAKMHVDALVEYLVSWRHSRPYMAPSEEGLARELQKMAATDHAKLLSDPRKLHRLHPLYLSAIIQGLAEAAKGARDINHERALDLAVWCTRQSELPYELEGQFIVRDWSSSRRAALDMVTAMMASRTGLVATKAELPVSYRTRVWEVISSATTDVDPPPERERPQHGEIEPGMIALNSVRGAAMQAVIDYALWVRRWQEMQSNKAELISRGFSELPEVRDVLNKHLEPEYEPSLGVRSVYGQWFPWLVMLDPEWTGAAVDRIFPLAAAQRMLFDTAWYTYVSFNQVFNDVARLLRRQYQAAAERIGDKSSVRVRSLRSAAVALGEHLLILYGGGEIPLAGRALETFFARADAETREGALAFVGRSLMPPKDDDGQTDPGEDDRVPLDVVARFKALWESRVASPTFSEEAPAFGWWFASGRFDDAWAFAELVRTAKTARSIDGLMFGADRFRRLSESMPVDAANFIYALVSGHERQSWVFALDKVLRPVLETILRSADQQQCLASR